METTARSSYSGTIFKHTQHKIKYLCILFTIYNTGTVFVKIISTFFASHDIVTPGVIYFKGYNWLSSSSKDFFFLPRAGHPM